jgi:2-hydroxycyclohexanecarboxyl-CoA dehydrogenase
MATTVPVRHLVASTNRERPRTTQSGFISLEQQIANTPVRRIGQPEDVAAACAFLVSEEAGYITGQIIGVNGGRNT